MDRALALSMTLALSVCFHQTNILCLVHALLTYIQLFTVPRTVVIDEEYSNLTLVTGDVVHLTCVPDSGIPIKVAWLKDGNELTPQANDSLLLHIRSRNESGRYECIATSKRGEEVLAIDVIVYGE